MPKLHGIISDKLRALLSPSDPAWHPQRPASPTTSTKKPKGVEGHSLGGRKGKKR